MFRFILTGFVYSEYENVHETRGLKHDVMGHGGLTLTAAAKRTTE